MIIGQVSQLLLTCIVAMKGPLGKRNSLLQQPKPFGGMKKEELEKELSEQGIYLRADKETHAKPFG